MGAGLRGLVALAALSFTTAAAATSLTTTYAGGNGQNGIMFDVVAVNSIVVDNFAINEDPGTATMAIYGRAGTHVGFENSVAGWTLLGTVSVTSAANGVPTAIPITLNVPVLAGQRYAFYITNTTGQDVAYTNGSAVGAIAGEDANVQILQGTGKAYPFAADFTPRIPNVTLSYSAFVSPVPTLSGGGRIVLALLVLALGCVLVSMRRRAS